MDRVFAWLPPGFVVGVFLVLILSHLFYAVWPYRRRRYAVVLMLTLSGVVAGQLWDGLGLPGLHLGQANLLPAVLFAAALQPFAGRVILRLP
jgi:hypothetical protein